MVMLTKPAESDCDLTAWWGSYPGHKGLDYGWLLADPARTQRVYAALGGVVTSVYGGGGDNGGWGNRIVIDHGSGIQTTYNHLRTGAISVSVGQRVSAGQFLAMMGSTGNVTGVHLHFELYIDGVRVDPRPYREGTHLPRLTEDRLADNQRRVLSDGSVSRRIGKPSTSAPKGEPLGAGEVGDFDGWTHGENVGGNDVWYRGKYSGDWFWSGGFEGGANGTGLIEVASSTVSDTQRVVGSSYLNGRTGPGTSYATSGDQLEPGDIGNFVGWARGENVSIQAVTSDVWFKGTSGRFFAAAGFTSQATAGLPEVKVTETPSTPTPSAPAITSRTPRFPGAQKGYTAPLTTDRPAGQVVDRLYVHHCAATSDQTAYFSSDNDRGSCPTWYVDGSKITEFIDPSKKPSATGSQNARSVAIETRNTTGDPTWKVSDESIESIAQIAAWCAKQTEVGGFKFDIKLDRDHILGHREAPGASTACPGPYLFPKLDAIIARAKEIVAASTPVTPVDPTPEPSPDDDTVTVSKSWLQGVLDAIKKLLGK